MGRRGEAAAASCAQQLRAWGGRRGEWCEKRRNERKEREEQRGEREREKRTMEEYAAEQTERSRGLPVLGFIQ